MSMSFVSLTVPPAVLTLRVPPRRRAPCPPFCAPLERPLMRPEAPRQRRRRSPLTRRWLLEKYPRAGRAPHNCSLLLVGPLHHQHLGALHEVVAGWLASAARLVERAERGFERKREAARIKRAVEILFRAQRQLDRADSRRGARLAEVREDVAAGRSEGTRRDRKAKRTRGERRARASLSHRPPAAPGEPQVDTKDALVSAHDVKCKESKEGRQSPAACRASASATCRRPARAWSTRSAASSSFWAGRPPPSGLGDGRAPLVGLRCMLTMLAWGNGQEVVAPLCATRRQQKKQRTTTRHSTERAAAVVARNGRRREFDKWLDVVVNTVHRSSESCNSFPGCAASRAMDRALLSRGPRGGVACAGPSSSPSLHPLRCASPAPPRPPSF